MKDLVCPFSKKTLRKLVMSVTTSSGAKERSGGKETGEARKVEGSREVVRLTLSTLGMRAITESADVTEL